MTSNECAVYLIRIVCIFVVSRILNFISNHIVYSIFIECVEKILLVFGIILFFLFLIFSFSTFILNHNL